MLHYTCGFENDNAAVSLLKDAVLEAFGFWPKWFHVSKCSIERMAKVIDTDEYGTIAIAETFFPIIADRKSMEGSGIADCRDVIELVDDVDKYYYRKLLTNNLGHAVLGYLGYQKGYRNTLEAMNDFEIYRLLRGALSESGKAICYKWDFSNDHIQQHVDILMLRYANPGLVDDLGRLARDPIRKLSPDERILLPINLCYQFKIIPRNLLEVLLHTIRYTNPNVQGGQELIELRQTLGEAGILKKVCKADDIIIRDVMLVANNEM